MLSSTTDRTIYFHKYYRDKTNIKTLLKDLPDSATPCRVQPPQQETWAQPTKCTIWGEHGPCCRYILNILIIKKNTQ